MQENLLLFEKKFFIISSKTTVPSYNFDFELFFECSHPIYRNDIEELCILRIGAVPDYAQTYNHYLDNHLRLINSLQEHQMASELPQWYPVIADLTPESLVCDEFPSAKDVEQHFGWPVFIKGARQTSKHNPELSIARDEAQYNNIIELYRADPILHWQQIIIRRFVPLKPLATMLPNKVPLSVEFRTFWWQSKCVGWGHYWSQVAAYQEDDIQKGLDLAQEAAERLRVPFLVIDIAKTAQGKWIIIECNDAQESGYTGVSPQRLLWSNILEQCS